MSSVLILNEDIGTVDAACRHLWEEIGRRGWLRAAPSHTVIQIGPEWKGTWVRDTARLLVRFLRLGNRTVSVVGVEAYKTFALELETAVGEVAWLDLRSDDRIRLMSPCLRAGVEVPLRWLQPFELITLTGIGPDARFRLSGLMRAQVLGLSRSPYPNHVYDEELMYEAHRLAASDLGIVCGQDSTYLVSADDVALEIATARALGLRPESLPHLRFLARHEAIAFDDVQIEGELPDWRGVATPAWQTALAQPALAAARLAVNVATDLATAGKNLWRIRRFVQEQLRGTAHA